MDYDDAIECDEVTVNEALAEVRKHGHQAHVTRCGDRRFIIAQSDDGEVMSFVIDAQGHLKGGKILGWLGY